MTKAISSRLEVCSCFLKGRYVRTKKKFKNLSILKKAITFALPV
jgi:hypothetical protein